MPSLISTAVFFPSSLFGLLLICESNSRKKPFAYALKSLEIQESHFSIAKNNLHVGKCHTLVVAYLLQVIRFSFPDASLPRDLRTVEGLEESIAFQSVNFYEANPNKPSHIASLQAPLSLIKLNSGKKKREENRDGFSSMCGSQPFFFIIIYLETFSTPTKIYRTTQSLTFFKLGCQTFIIKLSVHMQDLITIRLKKNHFITLLPLKS